MHLERWKQVDNLLQSVLEHKSDEREAFLRQACGNDKTLESEVRSLLALERKAGSFLQTPVMEASLPEATGSLAGKTMSHYHVIEKLGDGGMGTVWKARDTRLNRYVALKLLTAIKMGDCERKRRFIQEARAASALNHPNIITIHDIDQADGANFIAMEFVPGKALDQLIARKGLRLNQAIDYAIQVADALAAAHGAGIVHRDLKPGNIMVSESRCVKVLDFGLAKLTEKSSSENAASVTSESFGTDEGMILGTVSYMSPEQAEGKRVDARSDIFSFGALLYEMITGRRAFPGGSMVSILSAVLRDEPKPAGVIVGGLPQELDRIIARCLRKDPNRRYQHAGDLRIDLEQVRESPAASEPLKTGSRRGWQWWWLTAGLVCVAAAFVTGLRFHGRDATEPQWRITRLTNDAGYSHSPTLSPDGKLLAYSSDRAGDGKFDLYVKQIAGGEPVRLTTNGAGNTSPDFSPDGSKIVYRSNRDGGGIYEVASLGGQSRLLARGGQNPKYSPDGSQVAYWIGDPIVGSAVPGSGMVWVAPVGGGSPQKLGSQLTSARDPVWSPDGEHLLVTGYASAKAYEAPALDWWILDVKRGEAAKTGFHDAILRVWSDALGASPNDIPDPGCWCVDGRAVFSSLQSANVGSLWDIGISGQAGKVSGVPRRLTTNAGSSVEPACVGAGTIAFTNREHRSDVWLRPFDLNRGVSKGAMEKVTPGPADRFYVSLSADNRSLAFTSNQVGGFNIWVRELASGKELSVAPSSFEQRYPVSNNSGSRIAFSQFESGKRLVYTATRGGVPEKVCDGCLRATDWSHDQKTLLIFGGNPYQIDFLDVASRRQTAVLKHPECNLLYGRYSPDDRWVSFTMRIDAGHARIMIAPVDGPKPVPETAWTSIADVGLEDWAEWSPDGQKLYFTSDRDGYSCVWGQSLDANSRRPTGEPFAALHLHGRAFYRQDGWSATSSRIAMVLNEDTGNIWMMSRLAAR